MIVKTISIWYNICIKNGKVGLVLVKKERVISLMGTKISLSIFHPQADQLLDQAVDLLHLYKNRFSANDDDSELMAVNRAAGLEPVQVHPQLFDLIAIGKEHSLADKSQVNIAIGPLVQTWRIGFSDARLPESAEIKEKLALIDPSLIELDPATSTVFLKKAGMKIDLGALAKGYIADRIKEFFIEAGVTSGIINLGGNVLTIGQNQEAKRPWHIGIQHPDLSRGHHLTHLSVIDQSVVTSGIYERKLTIGDQTYHHIFDSQTGYPVENDTASLTILSDASLDGEIWTTRLFGLDRYSIMEIVEETPGIEAIHISKNQRIDFSSGIISKIV